MSISAYVWIGFILCVLVFAVGAYFFGRDAGSNPAEEKHAKETAAVLKDADQAAAEAPNTIDEVIDEMEDGDF